MAAEAIPPAMSTRAAWRESLRLLIPNRIAVFVVMWLAMLVWPPTPPLPGVTLGNRPNADNLLIDGWLRWDVHWYWQIARNGYTNLSQNGAQRDTVFFPLYPLLVHIFNWFIPDTYAAGMVVSNICLVLSAFLIFRLAEARHGAETARNVVLVMLTFPWSFFLSAMYTESLFLVTVLGAFYFGEQRRWVLAGLCAAGAGATRVLGASVALGLAILYLEQIEFNWRRIRPDVFGIGLAVLGPGGHMFFLGIKFRDPLLFLHNHYVFGWGADRSIDQIWPTVKQLLSLDAMMNGSLPVMRGLHLSALILGLYACYRTCRATRWAYGLWGLAYLFASLRVWDGMGRIVLGVFPLYLWAGRTTLRQNSLPQWIAGGSMVMALLMLLFSHWRLAA